MGQVKLLERSFQLFEARDEILRVIQVLNLRHELSFAGQRVCAVKCQIFSSSGSLVATGLGKGGKEAAVVGALFEAMEHYFTNRTYLISEHLSGLDVLAKSGGVLSKQIEAIVEENSAAQFPCVQHRCLQNSIPVAYPLGLFVPGYVDSICVDPSINPVDTFDYGRLSEYSSNSGVAIGMSKCEAVVHGVLEAAERDAVSRFMIQAFIRRTPGSLRKIKVETLPSHLRELADDVACEASAEEVSIYKIDNRFGFPTFVSWMGKEVAGLFLTGFGCSLDDDYAVERSLYELAQSYLAFTSLHEKTGVEQRGARIIQSLDRFRPLLKCAVFDLKGLEAEIDCHIVDYASGMQPPFRDLDSYRDAVTTLITRGGARAYTADFEIPVSTSIAVSHSFISGSEPFATVMSGRTPIPNVSL